MLPSPRDCWIYASLLLLVLQERDRGLEQTYGIRRVVDALTLVFGDELPVVARLQLRPRPGGIDRERRLGRPHGRQQGTQLVQQMLYFRLHAVDLAVAVVVH